MFTILAIYKCGSVTLSPFMSFPHRYPFWSRFHLLKLVSVLLSDFPSPATSLPLSDSVATQNVTLHLSVLFQNLPEVTIPGSDARMPVSTALHQDGSQERPPSLMSTTSSSGSSRDSHSAMEEPTSSEASAQNGTGSPWGRHVPNSNNNSSGWLNMKGPLSPFNGRAGTGPAHHKLSYLGRVVREIVETERMYVQDLRSIVEVSAEAGKGWPSAAQLFSTTRLCPRMEGSPGMAVSVYLPPMRPGGSFGDLSGGNCGLSCFLMTPSHLPSHK